MYARGENKNKRRENLEMLLASGLFIVSLSLSHVIAIEFYCCFCQVQPSIYIIFQLLICLLDLSSSLQQIYKAFCIFQPLNLIRSIRISIALLSCFRWVMTAHPVVFAAFLCTFQSSYIKPLSHSIKLKS